MFDLPRCAAGLGNTRFLERRSAPSSKEGISAAERYCIHHQIGLCQASTLLPLQRGRAAARSASPTGRASSESGRGALTSHNACANQDFSGILIIECEHVRVNVCATCPKNQSSQEYFTVQSVGCSVPNSWPD